MNRLIEIKKNNEHNRGYLVTIYNNDGLHPFYGDNIQMATKRMEIITQSSSEIFLKGWGFDPTGYPFDGYGVTLKLRGKEIDSIILHIYDRSIDLHYWK